MARRPLPEKLCVRKYDKIGGNIKFLQIQVLSGLCSCRHLRNHPNFSLPHALRSPFQGRHARNRRTVAFCFVRTLNVQADENKNSFSMEAIYKGGSA